MVRVLPRRASAAGRAREGQHRAGDRARIQGQARRTASLARANGDPYKLSVVDRDGRVGIDYGVYGVPETFVIDKAGVIRYKQIGPMTAEALQQTILPLVRELQRS